MTTTDLIAEAKRQLELWPAAKQNYEKLESAVRKRFRFGDAPLEIQFNPARAVSTAAKVDERSISKRPCFLCEKNRPETQYVLKEFGDWEVLLNPFPIFPVHFTIAHSQHQHQDNIDFADIAEFVEMFPGLTAFYNGSTSGASCPDHLHFQATTSAEIPLCGFLNENPGKLISMDGNTHVYIVDSTPALALHIISRNYSSVAGRWLDSLSATDSTGFPDKSRRNLLMWQDANRQIHTVLFLRTKHRPDCYTSDAAECADGHYMVSPGAVDMAGLVITPRERDFKKLTGFDVARILSEVGYDFTSSDILRNLLMQ